MANEDKQENLLAAASRVSVRFRVDNQPYNAGESAVFDDKFANTLISRGIAAPNAHEVRNDSNLMALIKGENNENFKGPSDAEISKLIDQKLDEKLKPILEYLSKQDGPKPPLAPAVKK